MNIFKRKCPACSGTNHRVKKHYTTKNNGVRSILECNDCGCFFSETKNTIIYNLKKSISMVWQAINARTEGLGLNATARVFSISINTILDWEHRFEGIVKVLYVYMLAHRFMQLVIEGDELYTKVNKNVSPDESKGWTIVLMDRASRFIFELKCGKKDRSLFRKTIRTIEKLINNTQDLSLITDGERRYGNVLFEICNELVMNGKPGRPKRTLKKGVKVRIKNKGSQSHKKGRKRPKYEAPCPEHPDTTGDIQQSDIHADHVEGQNAALRRKCSAFRRKTNTYAKSEGGLQRALNVYWAVHNFPRVHHTTKEVPAVSLGVLESRIAWRDLLYLQLS